jgi:DNA-binding NarL/FixJ family response regulator
LHCVYTYVLGTNYLAKRYLFALLNENSLIDVSILEDESLEEIEPDNTSSCVVVVDQSSLATDWVSYVWKLRDRFVHSRLVFVGTREFGDFLRTVFSDWIADVVEYDDVQRLSAAVRVAYTRLRPTEAADAHLAGKTSQSPRVSLSKRESEVLTLVRSRLSNKEIASRLNIAEVTVKFHVSNALAKIGLRRRRQLFAHCSS